MTPLEQEMLKALKECVKGMEGHLINSEYQGAVLDAKQTIAKAEPKPHEFKPKYDLASAICECGHHISHESHIKSKARRYWIEVADCKDDVHGVNESTTADLHIKAQGNKCYQLREAKPITRHKMELFCELVAMDGLNVDGLSRWLISKGIDVED